MVFKQIHRDEIESERERVPITGKEIYREVILGSETYLVNRNELSDISLGKRETPSIAYKQIGYFSVGRKTVEVRNDRVLEAIAQRWNDIQNPERV